MIDTNSAVVQLCAAGMAIDGDPVAAQTLFRQAWESRRDDYEASVAAHFLARHQATPSDALHWNYVAAKHAEVVPENRAKPLLASLYLNLADSYLALGQSIEAAAVAERGVACLPFVPPGGYREFIAHGLQRLQARIAQIHAGKRTPN